MWYVAELLFAQPSTGDESVVCETCLVLLLSETAEVAYEKALAWGKDHEADGMRFEFLGIQHLYSLDEEQPGDGSEIGGGFYESDDVWERVDELIPDRGDIPVIRYEAHPDSPIRKLASDEHWRMVKRVFKD